MRLLFSMLSLASLLALSAQEPSPWLTDLDQAIAAAKKAGQPIFVVLSCPH